jgi:Right handed beta helix region
MKELFVAVSLLAMALLLMPSLRVGSAAAAEWSVNPDGTGDFTTIQATINGSSDGDLILLQSGTYVGDGNGNLNYWGKAITIRSASGQPGSCFIDCQGTAGSHCRGFYFATGEGGDSVLEGVTITGGFQSTGGGILCALDASPTIRNCVFLENKVDAGAAISLGGGLYCQSGAAPYVVDCLFLNNEADWFGGGLFCDADSNPEVVGCTFAGNTAKQGGGIFYRSSQNASLTSCTFEENSADFGSSICLNDGSSVTLTAVLMAFGETGAAVYADGASSVNLFSCNIFGNDGGDWVGAIASQVGSDNNLSADPLFCADSPADERDWSLDVDSPCTAAANEGTTIGAWEVGCGDDAVATQTWGGIKVMFQVETEAKQRP